MTVFKKILKWTLIIGGGGFALYIIGSIIYVIYIFAQFDSSSYKDLTENYEQKSKEILELKTFVNSVVPTNKSVDIEFDDKNTLGIFHVTVDGNYDSNWDIETNSGKADTLLQKLGWTTETLKTLKDKLDKANCISVASGDPCQIGFQRSGMGKYFYNLFNKPIEDSLKTTYNDSCTYILFKDNIVLEWGGGAIGNQCFPDLKNGGL
jgi:hypothetical protein